MSSLTYMNSNLTKFIRLLILQKAGLNGQFHAIYAYISFEPMFIKYHLLGFYACFQKKKRICNALKIIKRYKNSYHLLKISQFMNLAIFQSFRLISRMVRLFKTLVSTELFDPNKVEIENWRKIFGLAKIVKE